MKVAVVMLTVAVIVLSVLYYQTEDTNRRASIEQARALRSAQVQLVSTVNQAESIQRHMSDVQTQLIAQVAELQNSLSNVAAQKVQGEQSARDAQSQVATLQKNLDDQRKDLDDEKNRLTMVEAQRSEVMVKLDAVSNELVTSRQQYADLEKSHAATSSELDLFKSKVTALEEERDSLVRQLNDLDTLRAQLKIVKQRIWEEHVADWKKRDVESGGNLGLLMKNGQWQTAVLKPAS